MSSKEEVPEEKTTSPTRMGLFRTLKLDFGNMDDVQRAIASEVAFTSEFVEYVIEKSDPGITERMRALEAQEAQDKGK